MAHTEGEPLIYDKAAAAAVFREIAKQLWETAPPKIEGGSPARAQFLTDVLACQKAAFAFGVGEAFVRAINGDLEEEPARPYDYDTEGLGGT